MKRQMSNFLVLMVVLSFFVTTLFGQNFTNNGAGTYTAGTAGTIRMKASNGKINGTTPYGNLPTNAVPGTVIWGSCTPNMTIGGYYNTSDELQPTYYTNLGTAGTGTKTYQNNVFVSGTYLPQGGNRLYGSFLFTYNGDNPQIIAPENTGNGTGYYNLDLTEDGAKSVAASTLVLVTNAYNQAATAALTNDGTVTLGAGAALANGTTTNTLTGVYNTGAGAFTTGASGTISNSGAFNQSSGAITLAADFSNITPTSTFTGGTGTFATSAAITNAGTFTMSGSEAGATFTSSGVITNTNAFNLGAGVATSTGDVFNNDGGTWNFGTGTFDNNQTFTNNAGSVSGDGVYLEGTDGIASFTNFTQTTGTFDADALSTINMRNQFIGTGGTIDFACTANFNYTGAGQTILAANGSTTGYAFPAYGNLNFAGTGIITAGGDVDVCNNLAINQEVEFAPGNSYNLSMRNTSGSATATYTGANDFEVRGNMRWFNMNTTAIYTYNNKNTTLKMEAVPAAGEYVALDIRQQIAPTQFNNPPNNPATEVTRRIIASYTGTTGVIEDIQLGWEESDEQGTFNSTNNNTLRLVEGFSNGSPYQTIARSGNTYDRTSVQATPRFLGYNGTGVQNLGIALNGVAGGGTTQQLSSGSEIILTQAPMEIISVLNGRWSNPATWDIGLVPTAADNVRIQSIVWTGDDRAQFGGSPYSTPELDGAGTDDAGAAANRIVIDNPFGTLAASALIIGSQDPEMGGATTERMFRTRLINNTNNIQVVNTLPNGTADGEGLTGNIQGLWVRAASQFIPVLGTYQYTNSGSSTNNSIIEVGICN